MAHQLRSTGYKKAENFREREEILDGLARKMVLPEDSGQMRVNADALDAMVCVLAGADFLDSAAHRPNDFELANREGWIWVRAQGVCGTQGRWFRDE